MAKIPVKKYFIPEGNYPLTFVCTLAMSGYLKLVDPAELTFLFEDGKTVDQITNILFSRVNDYKSKHN